MKQTIEIEVPDGKKAVWNNGKIEFIDVNVNIIEHLKNSKEPERDLMSIIIDDIREGDNSLLHLYEEYMDSPAGTHIKSVTKLKLFLAYLHKGHKFDLISGNVYYPYVKIYLNSKLPKDEKAIGYFKYKGDIFALVGGYANHTSNTGLASFYPQHGLGYSYSYGFLTCKDSETAQFVATKFAKLLFDVNFGGLIDYEWL